MGSAQDPLHRCSPVVQKAPQPPALDGEHDKIWGKLALHFLSLLVYTTIQLHFCGINSNIRRYLPRDP